MQIIGQVTFWLSLLVLAYTYVGYGLLLFWLTRFRTRQPSPPATVEPTVAVVIAAYNEEAYIRAKLENTLAFDYPPDKVQVIVVTDGSTDRTPAIVREFAGVQLLHQPQRAGKVAAVEWAMQNVSAEITVFTDANAMVNREALRLMVRHFADSTVGAVAGEKRVAGATDGAVSTAGEGLYWRYESQLKRWDSELHSVVGAAGELFAIRTALYEPMLPDTLIEDFVLTLRIAQRGYRVVYEPAAYALEQGSASAREELKRKIRIAAGGLQAISRMPELLDPRRYGLLSFQYLSHRVLRWTLAPLALLSFFISSLVLWRRPFARLMLILQVIFYLLAGIGCLLQDRKVQWKLFYVPFYFCLMNYAVYRGALRLLTGSQSIQWEKAQRAR
jgi:biofilm PGA synthesis N-glycosyltransferase PgaC